MTLHFFPNPFLTAGIPDILPEGRVISDLAGLAGWLGWGCRFLGSTLFGSATLAAAAPVPCLPGLPLLLALLLLLAAAASGEEEATSILAPVSMGSLRRCDSSDFKSGD